MELLSVQ
jgi:hypothetical protein